VAKRFDDWEIVRSLSQGGQAWTYLVKKVGQSDDELFVLKQLIKRSDPGHLKRFQQEIDMGLHLSHPNVLKGVG
jgi:serine/threonine protein kinase